MTSSDISDLADLEQTKRGPLVLLFYDGHDLRAYPGIVGKLRSDGWQAARLIANTLRGKQLRSGFYHAFDSLRTSLVAYGCDVRVNDFSAARARPDYPIGLCGYPSVFDAVPLRNPVIFGHGDIGDPDVAALRAADERIKLIIQPCDWARDYLAASVPAEKLRVWAAGVDVDACPVTPDEKVIDFLVYDKIRWNRSLVVPKVLHPVLAKLRATGKTFEVLRYGGHVRADHKRGLRKARAFLFLCEHESQGLACQEAMASGLPVLAWDEGVLADPKQRSFVPANFRVSSVPYFDERCGLTFQIANFEPVFDSFLKRMGEFRPRDFVVERLNMRRAAEEYLRFYSALAR